MLSSLFSKYDLSQFRKSHFCVVAQTTIKLNDLFFDDMKENTFSDRVKKARTYSGLTQQELAITTNLSRSTINDFECGYRDSISKDTLLKLLKVLDKNILCDDYCTFILNQKENIKKIIDEYTINKIIEVLHCHRSTVERYKDGKYQISRENFNKLMQFIKK